MIVPRPTDDQIRSAHVITLFDPQRPEFDLVLASADSHVWMDRRTFNIVDIPVDSSDAAEVVRLKQWVASLRLGKP
jgi:hypothetical protein